MYGEPLDQTSRASTQKHSRQQQAHQQTIHGHEGESISGRICGCIQNSGIMLMESTERHGVTRDLSHDGIDLKAASQAWALRRLHLRYTADTNTSSWKMITRTKRDMAMDIIRRAFARNWEIVHMDRIRLFAHPKEIYCASNILHLITAYAGGNCELFEFCWDGMLVESGHKCRTYHIERGFRSCSTGCWILNHLGRQLVGWLFIWVVQSTRQCNKSFRMLVPISLNWHCRLHGFNLT